MDQWVRSCTLKEAPGWRRYHLSRWLLHLQLHKGALSRQEADKRHTGGRQDSDKRQTATDKRQTAADKGRHLTHSTPGNYEAESPFCQNFLVSPSSRIDSPGGAMTTVFAAPDGVSSVRLQRQKVALTVPTALDVSAPPSAK